MMKQEVAQIARTRVSDKLGSILATTTPKGKNWVFDWFMRGLSEDPRDSDWESFRWQSRDNPYFPDSEWEDARRDLPEDFFRQEYCAEFLDDVSSVFRGVKEILRDPAEKQTVSGPFYIGLDLARIRDYTVLHVMASTGESVDWFRCRSMDWADQKFEILKMAEIWDATIVLDATGGQGDIFYGELLKELGKRRVRGVTFTVETKRQLIQLLQTAIEQGQITIQSHDALLDELKWFQYSLTKTGRIHYSAPKGYHDDCVWALALANFGRVRVAGKGKAALIQVAPMLSRRQSGGQGILSSGDGMPLRRVGNNYPRRQRNFLGGA